MTEVSWKSHGGTVTATLIKKGEVYSTVLITGTCLGDRVRDIHNSILTFHKGDNAEDL